MYAEDLTDDEEEERMTDEVAKNARKEQRLKWEEIRDPILLGPSDFEPVTYEVKQSLHERFKDTGLQVIVKMASIELTPEKPDFPAGGWHVSDSRAWMLLNETFGTDSIPDRGPDE
jgi:hypothetical protein